MNKRFFVVFLSFIAGFHLGAAVPVRQVPTHIPIVFHPNYDISLVWGLDWVIQKLHPFDAQKYGKVAQYLCKTCYLTLADFQKPAKITDEQLLEVHTRDYLESLQDSGTIARIAEVSSLSWLSSSRLQHNMLDPMRYATAGTVLGAQLALQQGWAINLGGGYHHAKRDQGGGFCFFADIPLAIKTLRKERPTLKVLYVDLDAHQGNGVEMILGSEGNVLQKPGKLQDGQTAIFDLYGEFNYPHDEAAKAFITFNLGVLPGINDVTYLGYLKNNLPQALDLCQPDFIVYNAGTDPYEGDSLGRMRLTEQGLIERDGFVFSQALERKIPILMVLSGGYSQQSAHIVGASIENLIKNFHLLNLKALRERPRPEQVKPLKKLFKKQSEGGRPAQLQAIPARPVSLKHNGPYNPFCKAFWK